MYGIAPEKQIRGSIEFISNIISLSITNSIYKYLQVHSLYSNACIMCWNAIILYTVI